MAAKDRSIYEIFTIRSNDGSKTIDMRGGIVSFSYFENVFSPMITAQVLITTTGNVITDEDGDLTSIYNGLPLRGGEKVSFKIPANSENNVDLEFTEENGNELYVGSITNVLIEAEKEIYALLLWHYHKQARVYFDVVMQVSNDPDFEKSTTIYNNDHDNSAEQGVGKDNHYVETSEGRLVDAKGVKGRYVRFYSGGNNASDLNHYIEVEVYGK